MRVNNVFLTGHLATLFPGNSGQKSTAFYSDSHTRIIQFRGSFMHLLLLVSYAVKLKLVNSFQIRMYRLSNT